MIKRLPLPTQRSAVERILKKAKVSVYSDMLKTPEGRVVLDDFVTVHGYEPESFEIIDMFENGVTKFDSEQFEDSFQEYREYETYVWKEFNDLSEDYIDFKDFRSINSPEDEWLESRFLDLRGLKTAEELYVDSANLLAREIVKHVPFWSITNVWNQVNDLVLSGRQFPEDSYHLGYTPDSDENTRKDYVKSLIVSGKIEKLVKELV